MSRKLGRGLLTGAAALAGAVLAAVLLRAAAQPQLRWRWDLSRAQGGALSARSAAALAALPEGSRATFFLFPEDLRYMVNGSAVYPRAFAALRAVAEEARIRARGRLAVVLIDEQSSLVDQDEARVSLDRQPGETVILQAGERRQVLRFEDLFQASEPSADGRPAQLRGQRVDLALGDAALRLARAALPRIAVQASYREGARGEELGPLLDLLRAEGYEPVEIGGAPRAGEDYAAWLVPGQNLPFRAGDAADARAWMAAEKPLLLGLGFAAAEEVVDFWNELLEPRGVAFGRGVVCEPWRGQTGVSACADVEIPPERLAPLHPITRRLHGERRFLPLLGARPLAVKSGTVDYGSGAQLAWMTREAWVEPREQSVPDWRPGPGEQRGPFPLVVACERWAAGPGGGHGRAVVLGSVAPFYRTLSHGRDLLSASLSWLLEEEEQSAGLVSLESLPFRPSREQRAHLARWAVGGMPGATLLAGLLLWWRRRR